jgi:hypothetical protein
MLLQLVIMPVPHLEISWKIMMPKEVGNFCVYTGLVETVSVMLLQKMKLWLYVGTNTAVGHQSGQY